MTTAIDSGSFGGCSIELEDVRKAFGATHALDGVSLSVEPGTFLVLLGPSGSGKTTMLRGLAGVERFDSGTVRLGSRVVSDGRRHLPPERRGLAMVFQDYALWPHLTVFENVAYALKRHHLDGREARSRTMETLDRVSMAEKAANYPQELSGGQQQRVALARAIVARPSLLLFDEPLSNLDADLREQLRVEIATLARESGATAVYITHDQSEAFALADVVGVLRRGRLEQIGPPEQIYAHPATPFVARFTGLSGSMRGVVDRDLAAGVVEVRVGDHLLTASARGALRPGTAVDVLVRPSATRLMHPLHDDGRDGPSGHGRGRTDPASPEPNRIHGRIVDVAYRGRGYEHVVRTPYGDLTGVFSNTARARGTDWHLAIDSAGCLAFPIANAEI
ncbi:ABC transporter ATP-binding protein [Gryllotalpicola sp.]|uniref:ABC transporter ATP-binding protein n=1 Tax=Gryllotalpicola sp. TaxID=1932787 RepID=UPI00263147F2|nr:ABC transporter ATP-binding protein [Gryllotalpicola sp.]